MKEKKPDLTKLWGTITRSPGRLRDYLGLTSARTAELIKGEKPTKKERPFINYLRAVGRLTRNIPD